MEYMDYLRTDDWFHLEAILPEDEALRDLGTFALFALHLLSMGGRHAEEVADILHIF